MFYAVDQATANTKVAKAYITGENVTISVEMLMSDPHDFARVFDRTIGVMQSCIDNFVEHM
jgi:hypothetical protein